MEGTGARGWVVDGHVHLHPCFAVPRFLDAALRNLEHARERSDDVCVLLLAEAPGEGAFARLRDARTPGLRVEECDEGALRVRGEPGACFVVAGHQLATACGLEVLALAVAQRPPGDGDLDATVARVHAAGGVAVVPWGFGKWTGRRGRRLLRFLSAAKGPALFLGDTRARLRRRRPAAFAQAAARGIAILPGSDPFPFPGETERAGSFGFRLRAPFDPGAPAASVRRALGAPGLAPEPFGARAAAWPTLRHQVALQLRRRGLRA